jgi:hypothetical protein
MPYGASGGEGYVVPRTNDPARTVWDYHGNPTEIPAGTPRGWWPGDAPPGTHFDTPLFAQLRGTQLGFGYPVQGPSSIVQTQGTAPDESFGLVRGAVYSPNDLARAAMGAHFGKQRDIAFESQQAEQLARTGQIGAETERASAQAKESASQAKINEMMAANPILPYAKAGLDPKMAVPYAGEPAIYDWKKDMGGSALIRGIITQKLDYKDPKIQGWIRHKVASEHASPQELWNETRSWGIETPESEILREIFPEIDASNPWSFSFPGGFSRGVGSDLTPGARWKESPRPGVKSGQ